MPPTKATTTTTTTEQKATAKVTACASVVATTTTSNKSPSKENREIKNRRQEDPASSGKHTSTCKRPVAKAAEEKPKPKRKKRPPHRFVLEAFKIGEGTEEHPDEEIYSTHRTAKEAAKAAWNFCEDNGMLVLSDEWTTDTGRFGIQSCYNVMVTSDPFWQPEEVFVRYMTQIAQKREVELWGDGMIRIDKEILE